MSSNVRYTFARRLPGASHSIEPIASAASSPGANLNLQPFSISINATGRPPSHRIARLSLDDTGLTSNNVSGFARGRSSGVTARTWLSGGSCAYEFPPTFTDDAALARLRRSQLDSLLEEGQRQDVDTDQSHLDWKHEEIYVRPSLQLVDASSFAASFGDDPLPSEQHPSYPFGRPIPLRPPALHPRASLPNPIQVSRAFLNEASAWNAAGLSDETIATSANSSGPDTAAAYASGAVRAGGQYSGSNVEAAGGGSNEAFSKPLTALPSYLARLKSTAIANSTSAPGCMTMSQRSRGWPFVRFGPGRSLVRSRAEEDDDHDMGAGAAAVAAREIWLERDFETLLPKGRERDPLDYVARNAESTTTDASSLQGEHLPDDADLHSMQRILEAAEKDLAARQAAEAAAAAHRGEPLEVRTAETEATAQLRRLFGGQGRLIATIQTAAQSDESSTADTSNGDTKDEEGGHADSHGRHATMAVSRNGVLTSEDLSPLLLDRYGDDAEELRLLLATAMPLSTVISTPAKSPAAGRGHPAESNEETGPVPFSRRSQSQRGEISGPSTGSHTSPGVVLGSRFSSRWAPRARQVAIQEDQRNGNVRAHGNR